MRLLYVNPREFDLRLSYIEVRVRFMWLQKDSPSVNKLKGFR